MGKKIQYARGTYSAWQLLHAANAYYGLSEVSTSSYPEDSVAMSEFNVNVSEALASATNRILALELYLKALLVGSLQPVPMVHNLVILFDHLQNDAQDEITRHYEDRCRAIDWGGQSVSVIFCFQLDVICDSREIEKAVVEAPIDLTLLGLLERNNDRFAESRYLFQRASPTQANSFEYEYRHLAILCGLLREILEQQLPRN